MGTAARSIALGVGIVALLSWTEGEIQSYQRASVGVDVAIVPSLGGNGEWTEREVKSRQKMENKDLGCRGNFERRCEATHGHICFHDELLLFHVLEPARASMPRQQQKQACKNG
jgi:hypothetical protein